MKKLKKMLAVISAVAVIAASSICSVSAKEDIELFEVPESVTTIIELRKYITEPVWISVDDWLMLSDQLTIEELRELVECFESNSDLVSDRLIEYFESTGLDKDEIDSFTKIYYEGALQIYETGKPQRVSPWTGKNDSHSHYAPQSIEYLTETSGTFESGVTYFYNEETKGLVFDGNGELSAEDYCSAMNSFNNIEFIFFGKDVTSECRNGARFRAFYNTFVENWYDVVERPLIPTYTYEDSEFTRQFDECMKEIGANEDIYKYYTVEDGTDPYTFVNLLPELPTQIIDGGCLWAVDETHTSPTWYYEGTVYNGISEGILIIDSIHDESYTLEDVLKVVGDYAVTEVCLGETDMSVLPAELQGFETIEEAEAELLRLINEAKAEETTEATVPTEVTEPTEAVEENTAETIADAVDILADETTEEKAEVIMGDVNGSGKVDVRDVSFIARKVAGGKAADLPDSADFNKDGRKNIRDAAALANKLA